MDVARDGAGAPCTRQYPSSPPPLSLLTGGALTLAFRGLIDALAHIPGLVERDMSRGPDRPPLVLGYEWSKSGVAPPLYLLVEVVLCSDSLNSDSLPNQGPEDEAAAPVRDGTWWM